MAEDHANAERLAKGLVALGLEVEPPQTNMVFVKIPKDACPPLAEHLKINDVLALLGTRTRLCTHLDVDAAGIDRALGAFAAFLSQRPRAAA